MNWRLIFAEARATARLALPMAAGQLSQMLMGLVDTLMVGRVGVVPLAAAALANSVWSVLLVFGIGLLSAIPVQVSHEFGAGRPRACGAVLRTGLVMALVLGVGLAAGLTGGREWLRFFGEPSEVVVVAKPFMVLIGWSIVPALLGQVAKQFAEALNRPWVPMMILLASVAVNVGLNWILIYGHWGAPALGLVGAGWATLTARSLGGLGVLGFVARSRSFRAEAPLTGRARDYFDAKLGGLLLHLGWPAGLQHLSEVGAFAFAAIMMGWFDAGTLAAHQIAITCAATTFMLPLGISLAGSIRVGQAAGAGEWDRVRPIALGAMLAAAALMGMFTVLFLSSGRGIAGWFVRDAPVIALAASMLAVAGFFQVLDGVQIVAMGALRGLKDVRVPAGIALAAYWVVGLPVGYGLAFQLGRGPVGLWIGLALGIGTAALLLSARLAVRSRAKHRVLGDG